MEPQSRELVRPLRAEGHDLSVLIDGRKIGDGGIGVYIDNLVSGLLELGGVAVTVLSTHERRERSVFRNDVEWILDGATNYSLDEMLWMPRRINISSFDLYHAPHYVLPFRIPIPSVVTVHDLIHLTHPEKFYYPWIARPLIVSAIKRATSVIAVSQDTRRAILTLTGAAQEKVVHVPNALSSLLLTSQDKTGCLKRVSDLAPFLLSIFSTVKPHKALPDLVEAYRSFRAACVKPGENLGGRVPRLVLAGYGIEQLQHSNELLRLISDVEGIHILGAVSPEELASLYRKATAVVVPSITEGFCLPALEAQACGTPVVCRPVPALLELITREDAVAADFSVQGLATAMVRGAKQGIMSSRLSSALPLHLYEKRRIVSTTLDIYRLAIRRPEEM